MSYSETLKTIQELTRSAEVLAALGAMLSIRAGTSNVDGAIETKLLVVQNALSKDLLEAITIEEAEFLNLEVRANLRRVLDLAEASNQTARWSFEDPIILQAQGKSSRVVT